MFSKRAFPKAILHVDGDAFFASCESSRDPSLQGKPIVVGQERGIATAVSYAAKALGVSRGMTMAHIRQYFPKVIILPSNYRLYSLYAQKMYGTVRRHAPMLEEYSIDECFADITDAKREHHTSYADIGRAIKKDLEHDLNMTFSVGIGPTKVLAKVASKWNKPSGFCIISGKNIEKFLDQTAVGKIWGIGGATAVQMSKRGVKTALEFASKPEDWVKEHFSKPQLEIWHELRGTPVYSVHTESKHLYKSVSKTGTIKPTYDKNLLFSHLSHNIERMCFKLRAHGLRASAVSFFLKTQEFRYHGAELNLTYPMAVPTEILKLVKPAFDKLYKQGTLYRATGITARCIIEEERVQPDFFGTILSLNKITELFRIQDILTKKFGRQTVQMASSILPAYHHEEPKIAKKPKKNLPLFNIPFLGEAT